jgi:hypothetical protein
MMKRLVCILAVLTLAAPTFADVTITVAADGTTTYASDALVRAMALDISVDSGQTITGISGYKTDGYSTAASKGYGIYMTSIDLTDPGNPVWGDPVADPLENPHSVGDIPGSAITVELGSLYDPDVPTDAPLVTGGTLFQLTCSGACQVTITANADIGGVVLEGDPPTQGTLAASGGAYGAPSGPECWSYAQFCRGDADGNGTVNNDDWPAFRDSYFKSYPDAAYNPCGDFDMNGVVNNDDWPAFRDNYFTSPTGTCPAPGTWPPL